MERKTNHRSGQALIEFVLVGIPALFLTISTFEMSLAMWQYHTLAEVAQQTSRYITAHGYDCTQNGNTCSITLGNIASYVEAVGVGLDKSKLKVTMTSVSGDTVCNPVSNCEANVNLYPSGSVDGAQGADITVTTSYSVTNPIAMFWPGAGSIPMGSNITLSGKSRQRITF